MIHFPQCFYINFKNNHLGLIQINKKYPASRWSIHLAGAFSCTGFVNRASWNLVCTLQGREDILLRCLPCAQPLFI